MDLSSFYNQQITPLEFISLLMDGLRNRSRNTDFQGWFEKTGNAGMAFLN